MSQIKLFFTHIIFSLVVVILAAGCVNENFQECQDTPGSEPTANLLIRVATNDTNFGTPSSSREDEPDYATPTSDELIHTLRIIIVRENGMVEHNRKVKLDNSENGLRLTDYETFTVVANESKTVYAFANEESLPEDLELKIRSIQIGQPLPDGFNEIVITRNTVKTPLFMSNKMNVTKDILDITEVTGSDYIPTVEKTIYIIRAAVKLTYIITNTTNSTIDIEKISFTGLTDSEYLLPTNINEISSSEQTITQYSTPSGLSSSTINLISPSDDQKSISKGETRTYGPVYCNEAPVWDNSPSPYSTGLKINKYGEPIDLEGSFDNLPALPRNTHVVIKVTFHETGFTINVEKWKGPTWSEIQMSEQDNNTNEETPNNEGELDGN